MHFRSLLTVYLPEVTPDPEWEQDVTTALEVMDQPQIGKIIENVILRIRLEGLNNIRTTFGRELTPVIRDVMERFNCCTEDKRFLEFEDRTEEYLRDYNDTATCIRLPEGRIVEEYSRPLWDRFIVKDGLVYEKYAGQLKHPKRTKKAKRMKALLDYPRRKLYKSFAEYVDQECYGSFNEENGKYGEWYNPDGVYDWYSIGGRWPDMFLVKNDCTEYSQGERGLYAHDNYPAPEGYMWIACARKKDIQWDVMREWRNQKATERFNKLKEMFEAGKTEEKCCRITEDGVLSYGDLVYRKGETLEEYISEYGIPAEWKYPISVHDIFHNDGNVSKTAYDTYDAVERKWKTTNEWRSYLDEFIDDADDEVVFVGIDYHI